MQQIELSGKGEGLATPPKSLPVAVDKEIVSGQGFALGKLNSDIGGSQMAKKAKRDVEKDYPAKRIIPGFVPRPTRQLHEAALSIL